ncbi:hypothetical protein HaLaN_25592 [Haematococcus lacustris]|uniref:Uncharacterized protein n=1 Tax=Haematococcus lacustris TaxID=44745 RepID=A0A6A0A442_HAELA|nr:hypothetical protein HaLaN_25592 [Haematococcus lacustris]
MDEEGRRLAVALAIVKAQRSTAQIRELESRAEVAEARLKKLRAGCGVLVSVLQKHMQAGQSGALSQGAGFGGSVPAAAADLAAGLGAGQVMPGTHSRTTATTPAGPAGGAKSGNGRRGSEPEVESAAAAAAPGAGQGRVAWLRGGSVPGPRCLMPFTAAAVQQRVAQLATGLQHCLMAQHNDQGAARARVIQLCQQVKQALLPA